MKRMGLMSTAGALALVAFAALPASASATDTDVLAEFTISSGTHSETYLDEDCYTAQLAEIGRAEAEAFCSFTLSASVSESRLVTVEDIRNDPNLTAEQRRELEPLAARFAVTSKWYTSNMQGGAYAVTQDGTFYYNGSRVWVTSTYLGYTGSQNCFANYVVPPWTVSGFTKTDTGSTTLRTVRCDFDVFQAGIINTHRALIAKPTSSGSVTYSAVV